MKTHIINYAKARDVFAEYKDSGYNREFFEKHRDLLMSRRVAKEAFDEFIKIYGIDVPIPKVKELAAEYSKILKRKNRNYSEYKKLKRELNTILEKIIPPHLSADSYHYPGEKHYQEVESRPNPEEWLPNGDRSALWNGDAHLKATILGSSETLAVVDGKLAIGKTGYVYFADFDKTRERTRKYRVVIIGE